MSDELSKGTAKGEVIEDIFIAKMQEIGDLKSYFGKPNELSSKSKMLGAVLAKTLKLEDLTSAVQHTLGMKTATVNCSFAKDDKEGHLQLVAMVRANLDSFETDSELAGLNHKIPWRMGSRCVRTTRIWASRRPSQRSLTRCLPMPRLP